MRSNESASRDASQAVILKEAPSRSILFTVGADGRIWSRRAQNRPVHEPLARELSARAGSRTPATRFFGRSAAEY
ncbi:hypothetical protein [Longimicrobium sp.]|uniref:hypothetical protein n=1 Tax=Longimicrobium sp. TaxID=2029185 RepID=UPI002E30D66B|nr:hypothetical protein [Longimicrobium sp.]HEX6039245.1 hypothetical protein [Longimicrobium sp.]